MSDDRRTGTEFVNAVWLESWLTPQPKLIRFSEAIATNRQRGEDGLPLIRYEPVSEDAKRAVSGNYPRHQKPDVPHDLSLWRPIGMFDAVPGLFGWESDVRELHPGPVLPPLTQEVLTHG